jgi:hypothetical protein
VAAELADIQRALAEFAEHEAAGESPLYAHLAAGAAADEDVAGLLLASDVPVSSRSTLFFAAAHRLVIAEPISRLADYYPSVGGTNGVDAAVWSLFREFVLQRAERMRSLLATRSTQTNEVRRAAALFPAVCEVARQARGGFGLLEAGCSAGLLLGMGRYGFRYRTPDGEQIDAGAAKSRLVLSTDLTGDVVPKLSRKLPVAATVGIDRAPVDATDEEELAWLEACTWADQPNRLRTLDTAVTLQRRDPPRLMTGDAVDSLGQAAAQIDENLPLVVLTSHVLGHLAEERVGEFLTALDTLAARRPLWWVSEEAYQCAMARLLPGRDELTYGAGNPTVTIGLVRWHGDAPHPQILGQSAPHGGRLRWFG